jgi:FADH2-dependent halogenase
MAGDNGTAGRDVDVIVIGGGPAGSSAACVMAAKGYSVLILEKAQFPRFHIGESMVPYVLKLLEKIGVYEEVAEFAVHKYGVEMGVPNGNYKRAEFQFLAKGQMPLAFNLDRAKFDSTLLEHAQKNGARVLFGAHVKEFIFDDDRIVGVKYDLGGEKHELKARFVVDASGRAGLIARHFKLRKMNERLENVALFQQYTNLVKENNPSDPGDLILSAHEDGWLWGIPIGPDTFSVGAVMSVKTYKEKGKDDPQSLYELHVSRAPRIANRVKGATAVFDPVKLESDFCYHSERLAGPGFFIVGDAGCFVDPLFSAGVYLGMASGIKAGEMINEIIAGRDEQEARTYYENVCKTGYDSYFRLLYSFYNGFSGDIADVFVALPGGFRVPFPFGLQTLSGDFWGEQNQPILEYLRNRPDLVTFTEPFDIVYGCPVYGEVGYKLDEPYISSAGEIPYYPPEGM